MRNRLASGATGEGRPRRQGARPVRVALEAQALALLSFARRWRLAGRLSHSGIGIMPRSVRLALLLGSLATVGSLSASDDLTVLRSDIGFSGLPLQLGGTLDSNGNGRRELLIAGRWHFSIIEEDPNPRGYREVARVDAPASAWFHDALLVDIPGTAPAVLVQWNNQLELRDASTWQVRAATYARYDNLQLGDVDGDGLREIVVSSAGTVELLDPATLVSHGSVAMNVDHIVVADIVGDARAEIVSSDGHAYSVTRSGTALSATEVWTSTLSGTWNPYPVSVDGHTAIVLHDAFGFSAYLATFRPSTALRTLVPADGPSFRPLFADANGDGRVDLITATSSTLRALDITSGATLWERDTIYQLPYLGSVYSPVIADLDADGTAEIAWADASYNGGIVAASVPPTGAKRWQADRMQSDVVDWTLLRRADGSASIAYLTSATYSGPRLGTVGFVDSVTLADQGGSSAVWLPGYTGFGPAMQQRALTALRQDGQADAVVVVGAEMPLFGGTPLSRWLWTFDAHGAPQSARTMASSIDPYGIAAAQVLDRPERQLVIAGWLPPPTSGPLLQTARVEVIDYATGAVLWQSAPLPSYDGAPLNRLHVADLDADGKRDVIVAYGQNVTVLTPATGTAPVVNLSADTFAVLDRGPGRPAKWATLSSTLDDASLALYDGIATVPEKTFVLDDQTYGIALFAQAPDDTLMFATTHFGALTVRRCDDGTIVTDSRSWNGTAKLRLAAIDSDGDQRIEIIGTQPGLTAWRLGNDYIFRNGFD